MKKHIILIMNIVLVVVLIAAIVFTLMRAMSNRPEPEQTPTTTPVATMATESTEAATVPTGERYKIGIIQHATNEESDSCYAGFISELNEQGLLSGIDIVYVVEKDDDKCRAKIQSLVDEGCDLLYAIGPFAAKAAAAITTDIPIVFGSVSDPEEAGLVRSNENPGGNVTGVSSYTPCFEQIELIPVILPEAEYVAELYNSTDESAVRQAIIAEWQAEEFKLKTERFPVNDKEGIKTALVNIAERQFDVLYLPIDNLMFKYMDSIVAYTQKHNIPIICGNEKMMRKGALATCEINYTSIGRKSAELSYEILVKKKDPATLPVIYKYGCFNLINKQAMDKLGLKLSETALANVEIVDYSKKQ